MKKSFSLLIAVVLALSLFTFTFAESNVTNKNKTSINVEVNQSPTAIAKINISTNDFLVVNEVDQTQNPAAESLNSRSSRTLQIFNQKTSASHYRTVNYSPPAWSSFRFEVNVNFENNAFDVLKRTKHIKRE